VTDMAAPWRRGYRRRCACRNGSSECSTLRAGVGAGGVAAAVGSGARQAIEASSLAGGIFGDHGDPGTGAAGDLGARERAASGSWRPRWNRRRDGGGINRTERKKRIEHKDGKGIGIGLRQSFRAATSGKRGGSHGPTSRTQRLQMGGGKASRTGYLRPARRNRKN